LTIFFVKHKKLRVVYEDRERELKRKLYQSSVLDALTERFAYSTDIEKVIDTAIGSLHELINYSAASYILMEGEKLVFKSNLVQSVSDQYLSEVKKRMIESLEELTSLSLMNRIKDEDVSGKIPDNQGPSNVDSFFNIPLVVDGEIVGLFNVSSVNRDMFREPEVTLLYEVVGKATGAVTKLKRVLNQQKDKLKSMVESMNDGVFLIDQDFRLLVVNPACLSLLSIKKSSNITVFDLVGSFTLDFRLEEMIGKVFETGQTQTESEVKVKSGYLHVVAVPVEVDDGVKGVGVIVHDQSEEHELERLRENFTAIMIHELRSPLTVIRATSDLLIREYRNLKGEKIESLLDQIKASSSGLLGIVNDLLDVAKIDAGKFDIMKKTADINALLKNEILYYSNLAREKGLDLIVTTNESIEPFPFDYQKITQVLNNLLSNAIKFTEKGKVTVRSSIDGEMVKISVEDTGRGIPEDLKPRLFNKFTQIRESSKSNEKGTGLGLVVAKGIIEGHGGSIWVEDNDQHGSVFIFTLPMK